MKRKRFLSLLMTSVLVITGAGRTALVSGADAAGAEVFMEESSEIVEEPSEAGEELSGIAEEFSEVTEAAEEFAAETEEFLPETEAVDAGSEEISGEKEIFSSGDGAEDQDGENPAAGDGATAMRYEAESFCYISPADFEGQNPRVGDLLDFSEVRVYRKSADEEPTDITDDADIRLVLAEYDHEAWMEAEGQNEAAISALLRTGCWHSEVCLSAQENLAAEGEEENWVEIASQNYEFDEVSADVWFEGLRNQCMCEG